MKKILLIITVLVISNACSDDFLDRYPKGRWHHDNYNPDELDNSILVEAKLAQAYSSLRNYGFIFRHSECKITPHPMWKKAAHRAMASKLFSLNP
jgi:hypothetical protein